MQRRLSGLWLGRRGYASVLELQRSLHAERVAGKSRDLVLLVEHDPVITLGRSAHTEHLLRSEAALRAAGFEVAAVERGGDVTLHGPGQLVTYPIVNLAPDRKDVRRYVGALAETMRLTAADCGVASGTVPNLVGLWVDRARPDHWEGAGAAARLAKVGAIGVRIGRWVTMHGFALNLGIDLDLYRYIVPCGIREHPVTSIAELVGRAPSVADAAPQAFAHLSGCLTSEHSDWLDVSTWPLDPAQLLARLADR